jgi:hypothetical protein
MTWLLTGFGLVNGFIDYLQVVTTKTVTLSLWFPHFTVHAKFFQAAVSSLVVTWWRLLTVAIPLLPGSSPLWTAAPFQLNNSWVWVLCYDRQYVGQSILEQSTPSGAYDQIFITIRKLWDCRCGALSLTRGRVCHLQLLLVLASVVILGSESRGTRDHISLSQIRDFSFRRIAGLRWRYSTPPPHGIELFLLQLSSL